MIKLRYKFYIVLFFIFFVISISFAVIINLTANYNRGDVKKVYYNMLYDNASKNIVLYAESIYKTVLFEEENFNSDDKTKREDYLRSFVNEMKDDKFNFKIYLQEAIAYDESNISVQTIYCSEDESLNDTYKRYDEKASVQNRFYPSYKLLSKLENDVTAFDKEKFYKEGISDEEQRVFYCRYMPDLNLLITACFYEGDLKAAADDYAKNLEVENREIISFFLIITIFIIIILFIFLCYIESLYYKRLEKNFLSEKLKIDEKYNQLKKMSQIDQLTKCYNRKYLNEKMAVAFKSFLSGHLASSAILFDIDNFKKVNDTYGHAAGDEVLKQVSAAVRKCIRKEDILARWGGEEFVVFFKFTNINSALIIAEKIREEIEALVISVPDHEIRVTASLGVSCFKLVDSELTECIERADDAMYESKRTGKNKVTLYSK